MAMEPGKPGKNTAYKNAASTSLGICLQINASQITISACFSDPDGQNFSHATISGPIAQSAKLAQTLAGKLRQKSS
jgi:porphobilinogen deaminase